MKSREREIPAGGLRSVTETNGSRQQSQGEGIRGTWQERDFKEILGETDINLYSDDQKAERIRQVIKAQFDLEIFLKRQELQLINDEIRKGTDFLARFASLHDNGKFGLLFGLQRDC